MVLCVRPMHGPYIQLVNGLIAMLASETDHGYIYPQPRLIVTQLTYAIMMCLCCVSIKDGAFGGQDREVCCPQLHRLRFLVRLSLDTDGCLLFLISN